MTKTEYAPATTSGVKFDQDKPRWDLLPVGALATTVDVFTYGAKKYTKYGDCTCAKNASTSPTPGASGSNGHEPTCPSHQIVRDGADNWKKVPDARRRYYRAALGHIFAWWRGEKVDAESGCTHLAHAVCCLLFLMEFDAGRAEEVP